MENSLESIGNEKRLKICLLGNTLVGKTALINRFINGKYQTEHDRTIEEQYSKYVRIKDEDCILEITDTGGLDEYQTSLDIWINNSDGFLLIYSINDKESFEGIKIRYEKILKYKKSKKYCILIVGNKNDLEEGDDEKKERKVDKEEVDKFCSENKLENMEVSALKNSNINDIFMKIGGDVLDKIFLSRRRGDKRFCCFC